MTIGELLKEGVRFLEERGLEPARLLAERLLEGSLSRKRYELYLEAKEELSQECVEQYRTLLEKRLMGIPSQYLLHKADFMDFTLYVDERCLIPRPETELLVEKVLQKLGWWIPLTRTPAWPAGRDSQGQAGVSLRRLRAVGPEGVTGQREDNEPVSHTTTPLRVLDVGTGSGNMAIALASYLPKAELTAVDCSEGALEVARLNTRHYEVAHRVRFLKTDLFEGLRGAYFDLIVSNPPYLSKMEMDALPMEVTREPRMALYGGDQGTQFIQRLLANAPSWLRGGGLLAFEFGSGQADFVRSVLPQTLWNPVEIYKDAAGFDRIVLAIHRKGSSLNLKL